MKTFNQFINESVDEKYLTKYLFNKTYLQEWETFDVKQKNCLGKQMSAFDNLGDRAIKKYKTIIPPSDIENIIKTTFKSAMEGVGDESIGKGEINKKLNSAFAQVYDLLLNNDISGVIHKIIYLKQPKDIENGFPELDFVGKPNFTEINFKSIEKDKIRKLFYYGRPKEIMACAWTHATELKNTFTDLVYKELDIVFPGIYNLFMGYVNEYNDIYEKWLLEYRRSIDAKLFFLNEFSSKINKMNKVREYIEELYPNKEELKDNQFVPRYLKESITVNVSPITINKKDPHVMLTLKRGEYGEIVTVTIYAVERKDCKIYPQRICDIKRKFRTEKEKEFLKLEDYFFEEFRKIEFPLRYIKGKRLSGIIEFLENDGYEFWKHEYDGPLEEFTMSFSNKKEIDDFLNVFGKFIDMKKLGIF